MFEGNFDIEIDDFDRESNIDTRWHLPHLVQYVHFQRTIYVE